MAPQKKNATCIKQFLKIFDVELENLTLNNLQWYFARQISNETNIKLGQTEHAEFALKLRPAKLPEDKAGQAGGPIQVRDATADNTHHILRDAGWKINDVASHKDTPKEHWIITKFAHGMVHLELSPDLLDDDAAAEKKNLGKGLHRWLSSKTESGRNRRYLKLL